jgi:hypothetical protein
MDIPGVHPAQGHRKLTEESTIDHLKNLVEVKEAATQQWCRERIADGRAMAQAPPESMSMQNPVTYWE